MFARSVLVLAFAACGLAFNSTDDDYPYTIPAGSQSSATTAPWCTAQTNSCYSICGGQAYPNSCDSNALTYNCVCSQGPTPNITQYNQTLPYFECLQYRQNCVLSTTDASAQHACNNIPCGGMNPQNAYVASSSASSASSTAASSSSAGSSTSGAASSTGAAGAASSGVSSATSHASSAAASATSAASSATSHAGAAMATAGGVGLLGAAVAGFVAVMA